MSGLSISGPPQSPVGILDLPPDILEKEIFPKLPPQMLAGRISLVCREFRRVALEPSLYAPYVKIIGRAEYAAIVDRSIDYNFDGLPPIDMMAAVVQARPLFGRLDKMGSEIEGDAGVAILDIPANLPFNSLAPFTAKVTGCEHALQERIKSSAPEAYRIMISRGILKGTRGLSLGDPFRPKDVGCRLPKALEISALVLTTFFQSPPGSRVQLFGRRRTEVICEENALIAKDSRNMNVKVAIEFPSPDSFRMIDVLPDDSIPSDLGVVVVREIKK